MGGMVEWKIKSDNGLFAIQFANESYGGHMIPDLLSQEKLIKLGFYTDMSKDPLATKSQNLNLTGFPCFINTKSYHRRPHRHKYFFVDNDKFLKIKIVSQHTAMING